MNEKLITVGNIYLDHNIFGVDLGGSTHLQSGTDYLAASGEIVLGGSATNVAVQASKLGVKVAFAGRVGNDETGSEVKRLLKQSGIDATLMSTTDKESTSNAVNIVFKNSGEFVGTHYGAASRTMTASDLDFSNPLFKSSKHILFAGTIKQPNLFRTLPSVFIKLKSMGYTIYFDPNRFPPGKSDDDRQTILSCLPLVDYYMPNGQEIMHLTQKSSLDDATLHVISLGLKNLVLKLGSKGCRVVTSTEDLTIEADKVIPITTVGAGDSFNAAFIFQVMNNNTLENSAVFANRCAAIKVSQNIWPNLEDIN